MTSLQKKKIWYSFLGLLVVGMLIIVSLILWTDLFDIPSNLKAQISSAITLYGGLSLLGVKVLVFALDLLLKGYKKSKEIIEDVQEIGEEMKKKTTTNEIASTANDLKLEFEGSNFTFTIKNQSITISKNKNSTFTSAEDFYTKLKSDNGNFLENVRKYLAGEIKK